MVLSPVGLETQNHCVGETRSNSAVIKSSLHKIIIKYPHGFNYLICMVTWNVFCFIIKPRNS
jgi:hypothetical protein